MDIVDLAKQWGGPVGVGIVSVVWALDRWGIVKRWSASKTTEREQLSDDIYVFIKSLQEALSKQNGDIENLRRWRDEDNEKCEQKLKDMNVRLDSVLKDSAKWRHLAGNLAMQISKDRIVMRNAGLEYPRFDAWDRFLADGGDPSEFDFDHEPVVVDDRKDNLT